MSIADTITNAVTKHGTDATFRSIAHGTAAFGSASADVVTETSIKVVPSSYTAWEIKEGIAKETDIRMIVDGSDFSSPPSLDDVVVFLGTVYKIAKVDTMIYKGSRLVYTLKLSGN